MIFPIQLQNNYTYLYILINYSADLQNKYAVEIKQHMNSGRRPLHFGTLIRKKRKNREEEKNGV